MPNATDPQNLASHPSVSDYPIVFKQIVAWGDMDALNHLNNVVYYRYAESARIAYLEAINLFNEDIQVVLAHSSCQYMLPVVFPDTLSIGVRCKHLGASSMVTSYVFYSHYQQAIVATGEAVMVRLDAKTQQKVSWSEQERQQISNFETSGQSVTIE
ncbi:thioesterase family protein [Psychrobacter arenosus]|uniref:acyl-CoA thioesterase n=1 Tax=Psychrobacter arenosus TaxID=256326 RepID=UPI00191B3E06|nr:thioesterase family protein [Psychrobacter arenosus]